MNDKKGSYLNFDKQQLKLTSTNFLSPFPCHQKNKLNLISETKRISTKANSGLNFSSTKKKKIFNISTNIIPNINSFKTNKSNNALSSNDQNTKTSNISPSKLQNNHKISNQNPTGEYKSFSSFRNNTDYSDNSELQNNMTKMKLNKNNIHTEENLIITSTKFVRKKTKSEFIEQEKEKIIIKEKKINLRDLKLNEKPKILTSDNLYKPSSCSKSNNINNNKNNKSISVSLKGDIKMNNIANNSKNNSKNDFYLLTSGNSNGNLDNYIKKDIDSLININKNKYSFNSPNNLEHSTALFRNSYLNNNNNKTDIENIGFKISLNNNKIKSNKNVKLSKQEDIGTINLSTNESKTLFNKKGIASIDSNISKNTNIILDNSIKCPEELHFFYINFLQKGKDIAKKF